MLRAYRVRFTNYKDGKGEWFYTNEQDAQNYAERFKRYGYTPVIEPIFFQEILEGAN
jgi:hypothetical protein